MTDSTPEEQRERHRLAAAAARATDMVVIATTAPPSDTDVAAAVAAILEKHLPRDVAFWVTQKKDDQGGWTTAMEPGAGRPGCSVCAATMWPCPPVIVARHQLAAAAAAAAPPTAPVPQSTVAFYWWRFVHNTIVHPLLGISPWEPQWLTTAHDWTGDRCQGAG